MVRLNRTYSLLNLPAKFFKVLSFGQIYSELHKILPICPKYPAPFINTLCFRHLPRQRTLRNSSELCKFHAVCPHSLRIMQNLHQLLTYYILCFRCLTSGRELSKIPANQAKFTQFAHISCELHEFCAFHSKIHSYLVH